MWISPRTLVRLFGYLPVMLGVAAALTAGARAAPEDKPAPPSKAPLTVEQSASKMPDAYKLNMLIRTTLIALNQANQTGNYSVLRDLGTPQFQQINSDARLAEIFSSLRQRNIDLSPIVFFDPTLLRPPAVQTDGLLRLTGFFDTKPQRILFDMGFEFAQEQWRLAAIIVDIKTPTPAAQQQDQPAKKDAEPKAKTKAKAATSSETKP